MLRTNKLEWLSIGILFNLVFYHQGYYPNLTNVRQGIIYVLGESVMNKKGFLALAPDDVVQGSKEEPAHEEAEGKQGEGKGPAEKRDHTFNLLVTINYPALLGWLVIDYQTPPT
jgi:hypothetical protein